MKDLMKHLDILISRYPVLEESRQDIEKAYLVLEECYREKKKVLIAGNGGSAADAEHIVGELMKGFKLPRKPDMGFASKLIEKDEELGRVLAENLQGALPAIALDGHPALSTAYMNDCEPLLCFAQQINGYGTEGDVFLGISTSGNSKNILYAAVTAHAKGMKVIGLTGAKDSKLETLSDVCIKAPQTETYMIQELHLPIYHCLCLMLEDRFFFFLLFVECEVRLLLDLKVKKSSILLAVYLFSMFLPGYFSSPIMQMVSNIMMVGVAIYLFSVKYKPSRFMILTICYFAYLIAITFIYHNKAADVHLIISNLKIVFMLCAIEYLLKRTPDSTINIMFFILITFVLIDFASIVLFPNGLYQTEQIWNEWSSSQEAHWIYGNKNNRIYWYVLLSIITWLRYIFNNKSKVMVLITSGISIVAMMLVKSSTATIVAILVSVGVFYLTYKKQTNLNMNSYGILVIYGCITVLILLGSTSLLKPFVEGVLHKDMTFTGRSTAWERVLLLIASKPVFGWGVIDSETATRLLKSIAFVNPHNQLLNCLWQGGIILVFILSLIMTTTAFNIAKTPNRPERTGIQFVWIGLLIDMIFEVLLGTGATWICLLLINHLYEFIYEREGS